MHKIEIKGDRESSCGKMCDVDQTSGSECFPRKMWDYMRTLGWESVGVAECAQINDFPWFCEIWD